MKKLLLLSLLLLLNCGVNNNEVSSPPGSYPSPPASCNDSIRFVGSCLYPFNAVNACNDPSFPGYSCVACEDLHGNWFYYVCQK